MIEIQASKRGNIIADLVPDLTPLLDVMFMLIVFFILTANAVPYALDVNLPQDTEAVSQVTTEPNLLAVTLLAKNKGWKINDTLYQKESAFKKALKRQAADNKKVVIIGDKDVSMQVLLNVMLFLRKHDIQAADIVVEKQ